VLSYATDLFSMFLSSCVGSRFRFLTSNLIFCLFHYMCGPVTWYWYKSRLLEKVNKMMMMILVENCLIKGQLLVRNLLLHFVVNFTINLFAGFGDLRYFYRKNSMYNYYNYLLRLSYETYLLSAFRSPIDFVI